VIALFKLTSTAGRAATRISPFPSAAPGETINGRRALATADEVIE